MSLSMLVTASGHLMVAGFPSNSEKQQDIKV
jgi:hypothetical protein